MIRTRIADCGLFEREFLKLTGVTHRTLERWNKTGAPKWVYSMLDLLAGTVPGCEGWRSYKNTIVDADGNEYGINEVRALFFYRSMAKTCIFGSETQSAINDSVICFDDNLIELISYNNEVS